MSNLYVKYFIKSSIPFYLFILIGIIIFIITTISFNLDVIITYDAYLSGNRIIINDILNVNPEYMYAYKSLNDKVYTYNIDNVQYLDNQTIFYIKDDNLNLHNNLLGNIKVDIIDDQQTLFKLIFIKAGKKDVE